MASYVEILKSEFPAMDRELFDYITGEAACGARAGWPGLAGPAETGSARVPPGRTGLLRG